MLSCQYKDKDFNNDQEGYTELEIKELGRAHQLKCPRCGGDVFFAAQGKITSHFRHYENSCKTIKFTHFDYDTEHHYQAIGIFYDWLHKQYRDTRIVKDKYFKVEERELKADLYIETGEAKIAFEIQFNIFYVTPVTIHG